jgi:uncharacterized membrane protein
MDYAMIQPNAELRACARDQLNGVWKKMAFAFFVYGLIFLPYYIISFIDSFNTFSQNDDAFVSGLSTLLSIAVIVASGPFQLGFDGYFLKRIRGQEIELKNIFDGFKRFLPSFLLMLLMTIFTFLWSLLLVIPGIIKGLGYSMAFYIMYDNPEMKPLEALKKSQIMMKGYKGKLFLLWLSFVGWAILGLFTVCIGYLWLYPYISVANFYENLKQNQRASLGNAAETAAA